MLAHDERRTFAPPGAARRESRACPASRSGLSRLFYEILFRDYPSTRGLFKRNSINAQRTMLSKTLMAAVDHIDDPAWLDEHLRPMGADHQSYGVTRRCTTG